MQEFRSSSISLCHATSAFRSACTRKENRQTVRYTDMTRVDLDRVISQPFTLYTWSAPVHCLLLGLFITHAVRWRHIAVQLSRAFVPSLKESVSVIHLNQLISKGKRAKKHGDVAYCLHRNVALSIQITSVKVKFKSFNWTQFSRHSNMVHLHIWPHSSQLQILPVTSSQFSHICRMQMD